MCANTDRTPCNARLGGVAEPRNGAASLPERRTRPQGSRLHYQARDHDRVDRPGLSSLIEQRLQDLNYTQSEAARQSGRGPDGRVNVTRSTVSRLVGRGLSPPLDPVTINGLAIALQVSQAEIMRAIVVSLGLGKALPDDMPPDLNDLILRVSDLPKDKQEMWIDMASALATVLTNREAGVRQPVTASSSTRRRIRTQDAGEGSVRQRRTSGVVRDDGSVTDEPELSAYEQGLLDAAEQLGKQQWNEEHGR